MTFTKEGIYTQRSIQTGDVTMEHHAGLLGEALRRHRAEGEAWAKTFTWFPWEGIGEIG